MNVKINVVAFNDSPANLSLPTDILNELINTAVDVVRIQILTITKNKTKQTNKQTKKQTNKQKQTKKNKTKNKTKQNSKPSNEQTKKQTNLKSTDMYYYSS